MVETRQIDRLARFMARGANRRKALKTMAAGAAGGAVLVREGRGLAAQDFPGEEWVGLYEEMAAAVAGVTGECDAVADALRQFQEQNAERIARMEAEIATWSGEQVAAHQEAHGARVQQAAVAIHLASTRCGYLPGSESPHALADAQATFGDPAPPPGMTPEATPVASRKAAPAAAQISTSCWYNPNDRPGSCECTCNNDFTVGNCIAWAFGCAFGGCTAGPNCCWSGICVAGFDHQHCVFQCINCTNVGVSC